MSRLCFRLLTALLTFAVGLAASALFGLWRTPSKPQPARVLVTAPRVEAPQPVMAQIPPPAGEAQPRIVVGGILNRKAVSRPMPDYPAAAKAARAAGPVIVHLIVGADGRVESAQAVSGHPLLQQAAAEAVTRWRFSPTLLSGQPVKVSGTAVVNFARQ